MNQQNGSFLRSCVFCWQVANKDVTLKIVIINYDFFMILSSQPNFNLFIIFVARAPNAFSRIPVL